MQAVAEFGVALREKGAAGTAVRPIAVNQGVDPRGEIAAPLAFKRCDRGFVLRIVGIWNVARIAGVTGEAGFRTK